MNSNGSSLLDGLDGQCALTVTAFLPLPDLLAARCASTDLLQRSMHRPFEKTPSFCSRSDRYERLEPVSSAVACTHDTIRVRLWLQRLADLTCGTANENVFETSIRSFVDGSMRRRLEGEMADAKNRMEEEVRAAKLNMLQCVQAISEEVDQRVREKVAALQDEFDRRAAERDRALRDMVEERVSKQAAAMKAEVDRRTDCVREALESRARVQEDVASKLQLEVSCIREALEQRVHEQEVVVLRLTAELDSLRATLSEVAIVRETLENKLCEQEALVAKLTEHLEILRSEDVVAKCPVIGGISRVSQFDGSDHVTGVREVTVQDTPTRSSSSCWRWLSCLT